MEEGLLSIAHSLDSNSTAHQLIQCLFMSAPAVATATMCIAIRNSSSNSLPVATTASSPFRCSSTFVCTLCPLNRFTSTFHLNLFYIPFYRVISISLPVGEGVTIVDRLNKSTLPLFHRIESLFSTASATLLLCPCCKLYTLVASRSFDLHHSNITSLFPSQSVSN